MRDLAPLDGEVEELDGSRAAARSRASSTATRTPAFGGDRVEEFSLRAGGASYEELHAAGGGILSTVRATRAGRRDELRAAVRAARATGCSARGRPRSRRSPATGSTARPSSRPSGDPRPRTAVPTWLGAHAVPPEFADADAYLDFAARRGPARGGAARGGGGRLRRAGRVRRRARRAATSRPAARPASRCGCTATSSRSAEPSRSRSSSAPARSTTSRRPGRRGRRRSRSSEVDGRAAPRERALPRPPDAAGARARRRRRRGRARHRLQPRQRVLREPAARLLARLHTAPALARPRRSPPAR